MGVLYWFRPAGFSLGNNNANKSLFYFQESLLQKFDFFIVVLIIFVPHLALIIRDFRGQIAGYFSRQGGQQSEVSAGNAIEMAVTETGMKH